MSLHIISDVSLSSPGRLLLKLSCLLRIVAPRCARMRSVLCDLSVFKARDSAAAGMRLSLGIVLVWLWSVSGPAIFVQSDSFTLDRGLYLGFCAVRAA
jgi:hypothetical protein